MKTMKLKFIGDAYYNGQLVHKAGDVVELDNTLGYAMRWVRRNLAVEVVDEQLTAKEEPQVIDESQEILEVEKPFVDTIIKENTEPSVLVQKRRIKK